MTKERKQFGNQVQFLLSCVGYAVGLGNIWRFPILAYENGGAIFIVIYLCCSFFIGLPLLYLELSLGQFAQSGPAVTHGKIRPYAQGIGWGMSIISSLIAAYYNVILAWTLIFIVSIFMGKTPYLSTSCGNEWNDDNCVSYSNDQNCTDVMKVEKAFYFNKTCYNSSEYETIKPFMNNTQSASTQFFENYVLHQSDSMNDILAFNWPVLASLVVVWILTALALSHGVKLIGKLSYFTATVPYVIIAVLFARSVTLPGAKIGIQFYLLNVDYTKLWDVNAWQRAATQVCYSLAIGLGGLLSLSSYNPRTHNCLRDAFIIAFADGFMSIFGGTAVFSVLGFMAQQQNTDIKNVVKEGTGLAFIAYPEAMSRFTVFPPLWAFLFFVMLFLLGISSQFGLAEVMCTAFYDQFPSTRRHQKVVVGIVCLVLFIIGIPMTTRAGIFYFNIFNDYSASFALCVLILCEIALVCYIYGLRNYLHDLRLMFGNPTNIFGKLFGYTGWYFQCVWFVIAPLAITVLLVAMMIEAFSPGESTDGLEYPGWSTALIWTLLVLPLLALPLWFIINVVHFRAIKKPLRELGEPREEWSQAHSEKQETASSSDTESTQRRSSIYKIRPIEIASQETPTDAWTATPAKSI